jgi:methylenetetrahydrofolate reductase (NADPH)
MATMNGSVIPAALIERLEVSADDTDALRAIGVEVATDLARRLLDAGAPGLHLYALNRSESVLRIVDGLGLRPTG